jgi:hypothetical protein
MGHEDLWGSRRLRVYAVTLKIIREVRTDNFVDVLRSVSFDPPLPDSFTVLGSEQNLLRGVIDVYVYHPDFEQIPIGCEIKRILPKEH